jgi:endonuclease YncB( thermonuclease family)
MKKIIVALAMLMTSMPNMAAEWTGTIVGIFDGDTVTAINEQKQQIKIRLAEIDAPEKSQDFGQQSKQSLSNLCFQKSVVVDDKGQDRYKRTLGRIRCNGTMPMPNKLNAVWRGFIANI